MNILATLLPQVIVAGSSRDPAQHHVVAPENDAVDASIVFKICRAFEIWRPEARIGNSSDRAGRQGNISALEIFARGDT